MALLDSEAPAPGTVISPGFHILSWICIGTVNPSKETVKIVKEPQVSKACFTRTKHDPEWAAQLG